MAESDADEGGNFSKFKLNGIPRLLTELDENKSKSLFKQVQWSPDGTSLLASTEDNALSVYILPPDILQPSTPRTLSHYVQVQECDSTKCSIWYGGMNLQFPETCCFLSATNNQPIHLWDALNAKLRSSYPLIDHRERYLSPYCMTFSQNNEDLICGTDSLISIFSISNPGPPHTSISTKKLLSSTKGIISALSTSSDNILAAGTFNNVVSLFSPSYEHISTFQTSKGSGITQIKWSPDSRYMYIIPRQSQDIEVWDIRSTGEVIAVLTGRQALTNQRIWTDLTSDGSWIVSGGTDGLVKGWKTDHANGIVEPSLEFLAHEDCVSAVGVHPSWPMFATCSGSHCYEVEEKHEFSMKVWVFEGGEV